MHNLRFFFSSKCRLFHNATLFGSCIIRILPTGVLKFKRKIPAPKRYILWVQEKEPRYAFPFSLPSPSKRTPSRFPNRAPMEKSCPFTGPFTYLSIPHKHFPKQRNVSLLSKALGKSDTPCSPKAWPLWKQTPISRPLLSISFGTGGKSAGHLDLEPVSE